MEKSKMTRDGKPCLKNALKFESPDLSWDTAGTPQQEAVFARWVESCVKNSEAIRSGWDRNDLHEPTLGAGASAPYKRTFLTPRENITSSNWSTSPVMSQRLQQRSAFQCMLQDFISRSDFMRSVVCVASKCLFWRYLFKVEPAEFCSLNKFPANITGEQQEKEFNNSLLSHRSRSLLLLSCRWRRPPCSTGVSFMNFTFHKPSSVHHRKFFCRRK